MKKLLIIIMASVATFSLQAQESAGVVAKYFDQLENDEDFVKVSISSKMFSMFTDLETGSEAEEEFIKAVSKLKGMKMVVGDSVPSKSAKLYNQALKDVKSAGFEELMSVKDAEEDLFFSVKEKGSVISELMMVVGGKSKFVILSIYGEIDLKSIAKMARVMKVDGFENLEKLDGN